MDNQIVRVMKVVGGGIVKNSPTILTTLAVGGLVTTVVMAVRATPRAIQRLKDEREHRGNADKYGQIEPVDVVKLTWKEYVPTAVMGAITVGCIIGGNTILNRRNAALGAVYAITEATLKEYQEKVVKQIGTQKEQKIRDEIAGDHLDRNPMTDPSKIILTGRGEVLCYDKISGRYFKSDIEAIRRAQNDLNGTIIQEGYASLNDFYYILELEPIRIGANMCWSTENMLDVVITSMIAADYQPCLVLDYRRLPKSA